MTETAPLMQQVIDRCRDARFTGIVRIHAPQGEGELWFVSGISEGVRFGVSAGDEAMERILGLTEPKVEIIPRLPSPSRTSKKGHPIEGSLGPMRAVDLFRFCETNALTCTLELRSSHGAGEALYELGELLVVQCDEGTDRAVAEMLEWGEGTYRFDLPKVELPPGVPAWAPQKMPSIAPGPLEIQALHIALDSEAAAKAKASEAEIRRKAEKVAKPRGGKGAAQTAAVVEARSAPDEAAAKKRADDEKKAEAKKKADELEAEKKADEAAAAKKKADDAEAKKKADEAEAKTKAEVEENAAPEPPAKKQAPEARASEPEAASEKPSGKKKKKKKRSASPLESKASEARPSKKRDAVLRADDAVPGRAEGRPTAIVVAVVVLLAGALYYFFIYGKH